MKKIDVTKLKAFKMPLLTSTDKTWLKWMALLDSEYGRDDATELFLKLWAKRGSKMANTYNLRRTLKKQYNIEIDESAFQSIIDLGGDIGDKIGGAFKVGKVTVLVIGGIIVVAGISMAVNIFKSTQTGITKKLGGS